MKNNGVTDTLGKKFNRKALVAVATILIGATTFSAQAANAVFSELSTASTDTVKNAIIAQKPVVAGDGENVSLTSVPQTGMTYTVPTESSGYTALKQATEGLSCTNGQVAMDSTGKILSCQSGSWKSNSSTGVNNWISSFSVCNHSGWRTNTTGSALFVSLRSNPGTSWGHDTMLYTSSGAYNGNSDSSGNWGGSAAIMVAPGEQYRGYIGGTCGVAWVFQL